MGFIDLGNCELQRHVGDRNRHNWWQRWDYQGCEVLLVNCSVRMTDYNDWQLDALREECTRRELTINSKDGVKTLAARLRTYDIDSVVGKTDEAQALAHDTQPGEFENDEHMQNLSDSLGKLKLASDLPMKNGGEIPGDTLSFRERMELLRFERDLEREREEKEIRREERR